MKEGVNRGGIGYGMLIPFPVTPEHPGYYSRNFAAMSPTSIAAWGLHCAGLSGDDPFWPLVVEYGHSVQNSATLNRDPAVRRFLADHGYCLADDGGLCNTLEAFASPAPDAGTGEPAAILSNGAMTYQGMRVYLYAGLSRTSPEVMDAVGWIRSHYDLETHAGFAEIMRARQRPLNPDEPGTAGDEPHLTGLFYYYHAMTLALHELGERPLVTADGERHDWPIEIASRLIALQHPEGYWANRNPRWLEFDAILSTSFALIAGAVLLGHTS
jgi:squalene-hopene/tetraprenyl-beta-curcumene cyclase